MKTIFANCPVNLTSGFNRDSYDFLKLNTGIALKASTKHGESTDNFLEVTVIACPKWLEDFMELHPEDTFLVQKITELGVSFYFTELVKQESGESVHEEYFGFFPMSNIVSINNLGDQCFTKKPV